MDMNFEKNASVKFEDYTKKTGERYFHQPHTSIYFIFPQYLQSE